MLRQITIFACWQAATQRPSAATPRGQLTLLWGIHFNSVALSSPDRASLEPPELGQELAHIGRTRFQEYLASTLPWELQHDAEFAAEWNSSDHSRVNQAFMRWQRRAFAELEGLPTNTLLATGDLAPIVVGVNYSWPALYESAAFGKLKSRIAALTTLYLKRSGHMDAPGEFQIFPWVEVYRKGDAMRPHTRTTGAYAMGRYFASIRKGAQKLNFEDPRGINPPYGKTYSHMAYEGNLVIYPSWVSTFLTPNMLDVDTVCICFLIYPADGTTLHWEDDHTTSLSVAQQLRPPQDKPARNGPLPKQ